MTLKILFILIAFTITLASCEEDRKQAKEEETLSPENTSSKEDYIFSTIVSKNDKIVLEEYYNGKSKDSLCDVQSLTKGLMSILIGIAIDKEYIQNVDEPIQEYFPDEFKNLSDQKKAKITIRHLLNQTSGLAWKGYLEHEVWLNSEDPIAFVLEKDLEHNPGEMYNYNSGATHLLSAILTKASGKSTLDFAKEYLFSDLNINTLNWQKRNKGHYDGSGLGLQMLPIDLMKIAQLLVNNGTWEGKQLVSKVWIQRLFDAQEKSPTKWGLPNSKHGFCWYQTEWQGNTVDYGMGYGGQFIIMIRSEELLLVATHNHDTANGIDQQIKFLKLELPKLIEKYMN